MLEFSEITQDALPAVSRIVNKAGSENSIYSCYNLYCLREKYDVLYAIYEDTLFVRRLAVDFDGYAVYLCPVGSMDMRKAVSLIRNNASKQGKLAFFFGVTDKQLHFFDNDFKKEANRDWADYIYQSDSLAALSGAGLRQRRKEFSKFIKAYPDFVLEEINGANLSEIVDFQRRWYNENKLCNGNSVSLDCENKGIMECLESWNELRMHGVLIRINGRLAAYNIGTVLNEEMFVSHVQKADISFTKIYTAITKLFSQSICEKYKLLNMEEDIGLSGLRAAKLHFKPCGLLMKYNVMELDTIKLARG